MSNLLIHVVESGSNHLWFIKLVKRISNPETDQVVITIDKKGDLKETLSEISIPVVSGIGSFRILNVILAAFSILKASKKSPKCFVFAQGHVPGISAYLAFKISKIDYGVVHHQSPIIFFDELAKLSPLRGKLQRNLYLKYILNAKVIQALSLEVTNSLKELGYPASQINLIGHGVDIKQFKQNGINRKSRNGDSPTILMAGRLSWEKNYNFTLKVISSLVKTQPNLKVLIAGKGPDEFALEKAIQDHELENHVKLIGWAPNIMELMNKSDLFLHLSITESFGQVILESCIAELPVFCFPVGISLDLHKSGSRFVHLIQSKDSIEIAKQISEYLNTKDSYSNTDSLALISYEEFSTESVHKRMSTMMLEHLEK
jgi:glycosyltransferase involved in cell wall biosynthesis